MNQENKFVISTWEDEDVYFEESNISEQSPFISMGEYNSPNEKTITELDKIKVNGLEALFYNRPLSKEKLDKWILERYSSMIPKTPTILLEFLDSIGLFVQIGTEFYSDGINWIWQIKWYNPQDQWQDITNQPYCDFISGTMSFGDNNEYSERYLAEIDAFRFCFQKLEKNLSGPK